MILLPEVLYFLPCFAIANRKGPAKAPLEGFSITRSPVIEKESFRFKELEHVLLEKADQLF